MRKIWVTRLLTLGVLTGLTALLLQHPSQQPAPPARPDYQRLSELTVELDGFCYRHLGVGLYATDTMPYSTLVSHMRLGEGAAPELERIQNSVYKAPVYSVEGLRLKSYLVGRVQVLVNAYADAVLNEAMREARKDGDL